MNYCIIEETSSVKLSLTVTEMLKKGWLLQGGVSVGMDQGYRTYVQALMKPL